jgi:hypothetical protein
VLGVTEAGMSKLGEFDASEFPDLAPASSDFASVFARALAIGKAKDATPATTASREGDLK